MHNLLSYHESKFTCDSDRDTLLSDNQKSNSSLENNIKLNLGNKSQIYKKK